MLTGPRCNWTHNHTHAHTLVVGTFHGDERQLIRMEIRMEIKWKDLMMEFKEGKKKAEKVKGVLRVSMFAFLSASQLLSFLGPLIPSQKKHFKPPKTTSL